jgi:ATP-dependent helicase/nuclease subunit B
VSERRLYLCPSDRSARAFRARFAAAENAPPDCVDFERFCRDLWIRGQAFGLIQDERELIEPATAAALWRHVVAEEMDLSDSEIARVAALAAEAWTLSHRYLLPATQLAAFTDGSDNVALFARCTARMRSLLQRKSGITQAELASRLAQHVEAVRALLPTNVVLIPAFTSYPAQKRLLAAMTDSGVLIAAWHPATELPSDELPVLHRFPSETQEMRAALTWAQTLIEQARDNGATNLSVAIVVPDLSARRDVWLSALRERFNPDAWWRNPETDRDLFNLSVALPLSHYPHVSSLLTLLRAIHGEVDSESLAQALNHPRWGRAALSVVGTERWLLQLLDRGIDRSTLVDWRAVLPDALVAQISAMAGDTTNVRTMRSIHATTVANLSQAFAEHAMIAQSDLFQLEEAWANLITRWITLDGWLPPITLRQAIGELVQLAGEQSFQPRAGAASVQVMGLLESAGVPFDAMWIVGLTDKVLPEAFKPHTMLPRQWQSTQQVGLGARDEVAQRAALLWGNWKALTGSLCVSCAIEADTGEQRLTPLALGATVIDHSAMAAAELAVANVALLKDESLPVATASTFGSNMRPLSSGDVERQAHCPRKAVAGLMRLREWPEHSVGISPRIRGTLVHEVMRAIGEARSIGVQQGAGEPTLAALRATADDALRRAIAQEAQRRSRIPAIVWDIERKRLLPLIDEVLALDEARQGFRVVAVEEDIVTQVFDASFRLRVDRVDDFAAAQEDSERFSVILDYKTGAVARADWFADKTSGRLAAPQLPLYMFALHVVLPTDEPRIGAIGYIVITDDDVKYVGIGADDVRATKAKKENSDDPDWFDLTAEWRNQLVHLITEIQTGVAELAPLKGASTCRNCGYASFCREPWSLAGGADADDLPESLVAR